MLRPAALVATAAESPVTATMEAAERASFRAGSPEDKQPEVKHCLPPRHRAAGRPGRGAGFPVMAGRQWPAVALRLGNRCGQYRDYAPRPCRTGRQIACTAYWRPGRLWPRMARPCSGPNTAEVPADDRAAKRAKRLALKRPRKRYFAQARFLTQAGLTQGAASQRRMGAR
jgi:hypothetical protein